MIICTIRCSDDRFLDLRTREGTDALYAATKKFNSYIEKHTHPSDAEEQDRQPRFYGPSDVIDWMAYHLHAIDVVAEDASYRDKLGLVVGLPRNRMRICVKDTSCVDPESMVRRQVVAGR